MKFILLLIIIITKKKNICKKRHDLLDKLLLAKDENKQGLMGKVGLNINFELNHNYNNNIIEMYRKRISTLF